MYESKHLLGQTKFCPINSGFKNSFGPQKCWSKTLQKMWGTQKI